MTHLEELQNALVRYKEDAALGRALTDLQLTPAWKQVIEQAYLKELSNELVSSLIFEDEATKQLTLSKLTGISALTGFLKQVTTSGELAANSIRETEDAINQLLGEEHG